MPNPSRETVSITASNPSPKVRLSPGLTRLFSAIVPLNIAIYFAFGAVLSVLLPLQVQGIDEANKAANLAIITGIGAVASMVMSPIAGLLSDRTRSRFGRRAPWMVSGALVGGLSLIGMGSADTVVQLIIAWTAAQIALGFVVNPATAILPDRVPPAVRGLYSTLAGVGLMAGTLGGQVLGAGLASDIATAYLIVPGILVVVVVLFVVLCPDSSSRERVNEPFSLRAFAQTFWVSPRRHPDFFWGFMSRLTLFTGYFVITGYQLYVLQDYIGLGDAAIGAVPLLGITNLLCVVISLAVAGPLSDRLRRRKPIVIAAAILMGAAMIVPLLMPSLAGMLIFTAVSSLGFGAYVSVDAALMSEVLPSEGSYAKDLGVLNIAATLPQTIGPFLGGAIVVAIGYPALFPLGVVLAVTGALCIVPIRSVR